MFEDIFKIKTEKKIVVLDENKQTHLDVGMAISGLLIKPFYFFELNNFKTEINKNSCILSIIGSNSDRSYATFEAVKYVRDRDKLIGIMLITECQDILEFQEILDFRVDRVLIKPYNLLDLRNMITATISQINSFKKMDIKINDLKAKYVARMQEFKNHERDLPKLIRSA